MAHCFESVKEWEARLLTQKEPFQWNQECSEQLKINNVPLNVTQKIRDSCDTCANHATLVRIRADKLSDYASHLHAKTIADAFTPHTWKYDPGTLKGGGGSALSKSINDANIPEMDDTQTVNAACLYCILQFGSGFRQTLHECCEGRGASLTISYGLNSMLSDPLLWDVKYGGISANFLSDDDLINVRNIRQWFGIKCDPLPKSIVRFCEMIRDVMLECGRSLNREKCVDFAEYIRRRMELAHRLKLNHWRTADIHFRLKSVGIKKDDASLILGLTLAPDNVSHKYHALLVECDHSRLMLSDSEKTALLSLGKYPVLFSIDGLFNVYGWELSEITALIKQRLVESSEVCLSFVSQSIVPLTSSFSTSSSSSSSKKNPLPSMTVVNYLIRELLKDFPNLNDQSQVILPGLSLKKPTSAIPRHFQSLMLVKRAQLILMELVNCLPLRFGNGILEMNSLCPVIDNVVPSVLMKDGLLECVDASLLRMIHDGGYLVKAGSQLESELRACALHCALMICRLRKDIAVEHLTYYLWKKGKFDGYRSIHRHYTRDTVYY